MKKVGLVMTPVDFGGAEKVSLFLLKYINRKIFDVLPIVLVRPWEDENVFIEKLKSLDYQYCTIPVALYTRSKRKDPLRIIRCSKILWSIAKDKDIDLLHTNGYFADIIGLPLSKVLGIPIISTCHGFITNDIKLGMYSFLDKKALLFADKIIAVSEAIKRELLQVGIKETLIEVIQNCVETKNDLIVNLKSRNIIRSRLNCSEKEMIVGYTGRLSEEKGIKYLIDAITFLQEANVLIRLLLIGDGSQRVQLERYVEEKSLCGKVIFTGFQRCVENWLPALDVFVLPSLTEGTPMALLEAMAYGLPVVASKVGGVPDIIKSGTTGILVRPGNAQEIADAICMLYKDEELKLKLGKEARLTVQAQYSVENWIKRIEDEYLRVAAS